MIAMLLIALWKYHITPFPSLEYQFNIGGSSSHIEVVSHISDAPSAANRAMWPAHDVR